MLTWLRFKRWSIGIFLSIALICLLIAAYLTYKYCKNKGSLKAIDLDSDAGVLVQDLNSEQGELLGRHQYSRKDSDFTNARADTRSINDDVEEHKELLEGRGRPKPK